MAKITTNDLDNLEASLEDAKNSQTVKEEQSEYSNLVYTLKHRFELAKLARRPTEERWVKAYMNYRGRVDHSVPFTSTERSKAFVKVSKSKTLAAFGQTKDIIFAEGRIPIHIQPTPNPLGIERIVHLDPNGEEKEVPVGGEAEEEGPDPAEIDPFGYEGDGNEVVPGESLSQRMSRLYTKLKDNLASTAKEGPGLGGKRLSPAEEAAIKMDREIQDQLEESGSMSVFDTSTLEMCMLGSGVVKGPTKTLKEYPRWVVKDEGVRDYEPVMKEVPRISSPSCWNIYPDPDAVTSFDMDWNFEYHEMTAAQVNLLKGQPHFRSEAINESLMGGPKSEKFWWEATLRENESVNTIENRYSILEYWGSISREDLESDLKFDIPEEMDDVEVFMINAWMMNNVIIRLVINPFKPQRIPYFIFPCEKDPYSIWGVGVPENMEDAQLLMNGFLRLAIDNAVVSGNIMLEVDESNLMPGHDMSVYPGKVWRKRGGQTGQSIYAIKWPNTSQENMLMFDRARIQADESTGIPSFSHGQTGVTGIGRTKGGIAMLMGAASVTIKNIVHNMDHYLFQPLGEALFAYNMQFNKNIEVRGDLEVKARGTSSLIQREAKLEKLLQFLQIVSNPALLPYINMGAYLEELAKQLDMDKDKLLNDPDLAQMLAAMQQQGQQGGPAGMLQSAVPPGGEAGVPSEGGTGQPAMGVGGNPQQAPVTPPPQEEGAQ